MYNKRRKLLFLVNPHAGKEAIRAPFLRVIDTFVKAGYEPTVYLSQRSGEIPEVAAREAGDYDLVVCSGGDGTLNETVNGLMRVNNPPTLGYLPMGTTNDFAASLHLSKNVVEAAQDIVRGQPTVYDVGRFEDLSG